MLQHKNMQDIQVKLGELLDIRGGGYGGKLGRLIRQV